MLYLLNKNIFKKKGEFILFQSIQKELNWHEKHVASTFTLPKQMYGTQLSVKMSMSQSEVTSPHFMAFSAITCSLCVLEDKPKCITAVFTTLKAFLVFFF